MTLYTTHCSRCRVLEAALTNKKAVYEVCDDAEEMRRLNFMSAPVLEVNGKYLNYEDAMKYVMEDM